jgi:ABC-type dipeptide/oligopeptide/nickel transport system permease component
MSEEMHLNESKFVQFKHWIINVLEGNLGYSQTTLQPINKLIKPCIINTLKLFIPAFF